MLKTILALGLILAGFCSLTDISRADDRHVTVEVPTVQYNVQYGTNNFLVPVRTTATFENLSYGDKYAIEVIVDFPGNCYEYRYGTVSSSSTKNYNLTSSINCTIDFPIQSSMDLRVLAYAWASNNSTKDTAVDTEIIKIRLKA